MHASLTASSIIQDDFVQYKIIAKLDERLAPSVILQLNLEGNSLITEVVSVTLSFTPKEVKPNIITLNQCYILLCAVGSEFNTNPVVFFLVIDLNLPPSPPPPPPPPPSSVELSLSSALQLYEQSPECLQYAAMSALPWSKELQDSQPSDRLTDHDLSHDFILLNLSKISDISYNLFSFNSAEVDFNLQLRVCECPTMLRRDVVFVKKYLPSGGNPYPLRSEVTGLCSSVDKLVISLHHDSSSHLPHPGPYLMEHYLLFKSRALFPYAQNPQFPVLAVDHYISLGPHTHVSFVKSEMLKTGDQAQNGEVSTFGGHFPALPIEDLSGIRFGGLLLYLCEEKLSNDHLKQLNFVTGASLCLVTRDCKSLVREVARLDLEEHWKFRLRDEFQTACADDMTPLFFLIGKFEGQ